MAKKKTRSKGSEIPGFIQKQEQYYRKELEKASKKAKGYGYKSLDAWLDSGIPGDPGAPMTKSQSKVHAIKQSLEDMVHDRRIGKYSPGFSYRVGETAKSARKSPVKKSPVKKSAVKKSPAKKSKRK